MIELTQQQQHAVDTSPAPRLIDPRTNKTYVLVGAEVYERVKGLVADEDDIGMEQIAMLVDSAMAEDDAGDPTLASYQQKYGRQP